MDSELTQPSIIEIFESSLVRKLMADPHWRKRLVNIHGIPDNVGYHLEVPLAGLPGNPEGDIDILLFEPGCPEQATAIQVKRVKVGEYSFATGRPNKLSDYRKGIQQANLLENLGFGQVYLYIFIVVDSRTQNMVSIPTKDLRPNCATRLIMRSHSVLWRLVWV